MEKIDWTKPEIYDEWWSSLTLQQKAEVFWKMGDTFASRKK